MNARDTLWSQASALIAKLADGTRDDAARDALLRALLVYQREAIKPYARIVQQLAQQADGDPLGWPAVPTDVFRFTRVAAHAEQQDVRVFRTSGTTSGTRGLHALRDLALYDQAARAAAQYALFPDRKRMPLIVLASRSSEQLDSSLSYMLDRFGDWFGQGESTYVLRENVLDAELLERTLLQVQRSGEPVALLGTSFAFVHAEDALGPRRFELPAGSRIMQTGGFKGRSRTVEPAAMLRLLSERYGIGEAWIVQEYGMTELSSQLYETTLRDAALRKVLGPRRLWVPGWVRATPVDPETLRPVAADAEGLLRIDDLANVDSASAIQTSDRARRVLDGVVVLGRAAGATPRGCSLALDAALGG